MLVDNGSHRADSTLSLRRVAARLSEAVGRSVHPVSLLHSTKVDPSELGGVPAQIFEPFIKARRTSHGTHSFLVVPLFFGHSAAIFEYLPQRIREIRETWPELEVRIAPCMVDIDNEADTGVAEILAELVREKITAEGLHRPAVTLVDHGTPRIAVNRVRNVLADRLREQLGEEVRAVAPSSMERREGDEYAFNEPLLENLLGAGEFVGDVVLSMLFISPGRHAGSGGDIAQICEAAESRHPGLKTWMSDLFASHPGAIDLLATRYRQGLASAPVEAEVAPPKAVRQGS
ncbi:MAG: cobalamin biosynthesis protein CbiX [Verrucomicrobiae bacterium]|nr:cobalamin biosynthesis protein CbiX [Verrucomicrobiae bacterium]